MRIKIACFAASYFVLVCFSSLLLANDDNDPPVSYAHGAQLGSAGCTSCSVPRCCQYVNPQAGCVKFGETCPPWIGPCCGSIIGELFCDIRNGINGLLACQIGCPDGCDSGCIGQGRLRDVWPCWRFPKLDCGGLFYALISPFCGLCDSCAGLGGACACNGTADGYIVDGDWSGGSVIDLSPEDAGPILAPTVEKDTPKQSTENSSASHEQQSLIGPDVTRAESTIRRLRHTVPTRSIRASATGKPNARRHRSARDNRQDLAAGKSVTQTIKPPRISTSQVRETLRGSPPASASSRGVNFGDQFGKSLSRDRKRRYGSLFK